MRSALKRGKTIEQFLGGDGKTIQWISLRLGSEGAQVTHFHVRDPGDPAYIDVYTFASVEEDYVDGTTFEFSDVESALEFCAEKYGARSDRFVNEFVVQSEYEDYLEGQLPAEGNVHPK